MIVLLKFSVSFTYKLQHINKILSFVTVTVFIHNFINYICICSVTHSIFKRLKDLYIKYDSVHSDYKTKL